MNSRRSILSLLCLVVMSRVGLAAEPALDAAIERRLVRLKRTDAARQELVTERNKVNSQLQAVPLNAVN